MKRLQGRAALVTGATRRIGRAIAVALAREGAFVVISGRDASLGAEAADHIRKQGGQAEFVQADLLAEDGVLQLAQQARVAAGGSIDILVHNAAHIAYQSALEVTPEIFDHAMAVNVKAPVLLTKALVPDMIERGRGAVINIGSVGGFIGAPGTSVYGSTKAALLSLTKSWATEFGPHGVRVNAVAPGPIVTDSNEGNLPVLQQLTAGSPAGRPGTPEEVAQAVAWLASEDASYCHGHTLAVDGGMLAALSATGTPVTAALDTGTTP
jgi:NAD(P)-dependent dehydrogenase (short-subunit alcohol dehydrogenase family)